MNCIYFLNMEGIYMACGETMSVNGPDQKAPLGTSAQVAGIQRDEFANDSCEDLQRRVLVLRGAVRDLHDAERQKTLELDHVRQEAMLANASVRDFSNIIDALKEALAERNDDIEALTKQVRGLQATNTNLKRVNAENTRRLTAIRALA